MIRPPPLQLKLDNRFPNPVRTPSQPKSKSFVSQLYKASWKNPVIAVAGLNGLRYAFAVHKLLQDAIVDDAEGAENLFKVSIALGAMYVVAFSIEIYGIIGVSLQRLSLVRAYVYLALLACLLVIGAGVLEGVSYFVFAEELMWECMALATEGRGYEKSLFRTSPWPLSDVPILARAARKQCVAAWVAHSWSQVFVVFIFSFVPAMVYYVMVYTYYRQTTDLGHSANLIRNSRTDNARGGGGTANITTALRQRGSGRDNGYSRVATQLEEGISSSRMHAGNPLSARHRAAARSIRGTQQAVAGPSNSRSVLTSRSTTSLTTGKSQKRTFTPRSLVRPHRPPPLMASPSPLGFGFFGSGLNPHLQVPVPDVHANTNVRSHANSRTTTITNMSSVSPGPPTYGNIYGQSHARSRVYAAFAAPVDVDAEEYDKLL